MSQIFTCIQIAVEFNTALLWTPTDIDTSFDNNDSLHSFSVEKPNSKLNMDCRQASLFCLAKNNKMISSTCNS